MISKIYCICLVILVSINTLPGQDSLECNSIFPKGIVIEYGVGNYSVKDEYISKEKYSGTLPNYSFGWARKHDTYVYQLDLYYRYSSQIKNNTITTEINQFTLNQGFLYSLNKISLFQKDLYLWLGPTTELFFFSNDQNIAVSGFDYAQSYAGLLSAALNAKGIYPLNQVWIIESSVRFSVLSLGFHMVDNEEDDQSPVKFLTLFSGLNASFELGTRYYLWESLLIKLAYRFELTRITAWEPLLAASDNVMIGLTCGF
jgi:hypothetical protein